MERICPKCGESKELSTDNWHRNKGRKNGLSNWCKVCNNEQNEGKRVPAGLIIPEKDLSFQGIPKISLELGHKYKFIIPARGNAKQTNKFEGQVIQINDRHITLKHNLGFAETFLKWDLAQYKVREV